MPMSASKLSITLCIVFVHNTIPSAPAALSDRPTA